MNIIFLLYGTQSQREMTADWSSQGTDRRLFHDSAVGHNDLSLAQLITLVVCSGPWKVVS